MATLCQFDRTGNRAPDLPHDNVCLTTELIGRLTFKTGRPYKNVFILFRFVFSVFSALYKAIKAPKTIGIIPTPRAQHVTSIAGNHSSIALYPSDVTFSSVDLVTTIDDDDKVIKARKKEEKDFLQGYILFNNLLAELGACRNLLQDRIINRLTTNPTIAPSKHLYLAKVSQSGVN